MNIQDQPYEPTPPPVAAAPVPAAVYWQYLDNMELSDTQKTELLNALWSMMATFVDLGFGVDPVQQLMPALIEAALETDGDTLEQGEGQPDFNAAAKPGTREDRHD